MMTSAYFADPARGGASFGGVARLAIAGVLVTIAAVVAALVSDKAAARSFWCGIVAAPVLLAVGASCTLIAFRAI